MRVARTWTLALLAGVVLFGLLLSVGTTAQLDLDAPLPVDQAVRRGALDNGMAYWVRSHATPPGKVSFWLHVATGSLNEKDGQEGMAHFLEHMAFNGSENFPPGELLPYFESIGLRFGQHQNAFTGLDQTTYILTLPDTEAETIDKGLLYLSDVAFRMLLLPEEIDKERGVIIEEKRARKGTHQRVMEQFLPAVLPGSRVARRLPIGLDETLNAIQREDMLDYYTTWYHPGKATLLAVGDLPADTMVAAIKRHFDAWQREDAPPEDLEAGIQPFEGPRAVVLTDPELTVARMETLSILPYAPRKTVGDYRRHLVEQVGTWIINRRMEQRIQEGNVPYQDAGTYISRFFGVARQAVSGAEAAPEDWKESFEALIEDVKTARIHGFSPTELDAAVRALQAEAEHAEQTEATRDAHAFLGSMNGVLRRGELPRSASQTLALVTDILPTITPKEVAETFAARFLPGQGVHILILPEASDESLPSSEDVLQVVQDALNQPVVAWQAKESPTSLLMRDPRPGEIAARTQFEPLDVTHVTFSNQARMHYRFVDFKKDYVAVTVTLAGGRIRENPDQRGITAVAAQPLSKPATSRFSSTDIRDLMTGKQVQVQARTDADSITLTVAGTPEDLEDGLRLVHLLMLDATIEPTLVELWKNQELQTLASQRKDIGSRGYEAVRLVLSGNDPRQARLTAEQINERAAAIPEAQAWLDDILRSAPMEIAVVGDIPRERAIELAAKYLGSLPKRQLRDSGLDALRGVAGFAGPITRTVEVETITPRAHPILLWRSAPWHDVRGRRLMFMAARILERRIRKEIREDRGLTYSAETYVHPSRVYPDMSALYVDFTADPEKVTEAVEIAKRTVEEFAAGGPTDEEVETVRTQLRNSLETMLKEPQFWVYILADLEYHGTRLQDIVGLVDKLVGYSKADIAEQVRKVVVPERFALVIATPKSEEENDREAQREVP
ncbi:MAG: insulinase family protein [Candidatus Tectomicrobia bacterium]|nr:insulinase family protein [Candidatus Tectomicrobia bacterium]